MRWTDLHTGLVSLGLVLTAGVLGCGAADVRSQGAPATREPSRELLGNVNFGSDCSPSDQQLFRAAMEWGRSATFSTAYQECITQTMQDYIACTGDPWATETLPGQIQKVLAVSQSPNDVLIDCPAQGVDAWANIGTYGHTDAEQLWFSGLLSWARQRVQADPVDAYAGLAGTVWHEAMHTHGYRHGSTGGGDPAADRRECGVPPAPTPWENVPYAVGGCLSQVIRRSEARCGANTCADTASKLLVSHYEGNACECVADPSRSFSMSVAPSAVSIAANDSASVHLSTTARKNARAIALTFSTPAGVVAGQYDPTSVTAGQGVDLGFAVPLGTAPGPKGPITITGDDGIEAHYVTVDVTTTACAPRTCNGVQCGSYDDGCGHTLSCGTCASGQACTAGVCVANRCAKPRACPKGYGWVAADCMCEAF